MQNKRSGKSFALTEEMRQSLRETRYEQGLSIDVLARRLQVSWLTLRNWENGKTLQCHPGNYYRLRKYLEDSRKKMAVEERKKEPQDSTEMLRGILERLVKVVNVCVESPDVREMLIRALNQAELERRGISEVAEGERNYKV